MPHDFTWKDRLFIINSYQGIPFELICLSNGGVLVDTKYSVLAVGTQVYHALVTWKSNFVKKKTASFSYARVWFMN